MHDSHCEMLPTDSVFKDELPRCTQESCRDTAPTRSGEGEGNDESAKVEEKTYKGLVKPGLCVCVCVCVFGGILACHMCVCV